MVGGPVAVPWAVGFLSTGLAAKAPAPRSESVVACTFFESLASYEPAV